MAPKWHTWDATTHYDERFFGFHFDWPFVDREHLPHYVLFHRFVRKEEMPDGYCATNENDCPCGGTHV